MRHIAQLAGANGARAIRLRVLRSNDSASSFYERLGYRAITEDDGSLILEFATHKPS